MLIVDLGLDEFVLGDDVVDEFGLGGDGELVDDTDGEFPESITVEGLFLESLLVSGQTSARKIRQFRRPFEANGDHLSEASFSQLPRRGPQQTALK